MLSCGAAAWSQNSSPSNSTPSKAQPPDSTSSKPATAQAPKLAPPRSDTINANELGDEPGQSSSKDTLIDLSPPADDAKTHPQNSDALKDEKRPSGTPDVGEFHPWNPHKAAKDIEVGDFYFKRKNYRAAEDRYREALFYKDNDAVATFRLAQCLEKMDQPDEARKEYESYLQILPHGPQAEAAHKAIERLKGNAANADAGR
jgi:tetratricopeptide (TPR) repeat protein